MMKFHDLASGLSIYVDPVAIQAVMPAIAPPPPGIAPEHWIPKAVGVQLVIAGCAPLAVRGDPATVADDVGSAKSASRFEDEIAF